VHDGGAEAEQPERGAFSVQQVDGGACHLLGCGHVVLQCVDACCDPSPEGVEVDLLGAGVDLALRVGFAVALDLGCGVEAEAPADGGGADLAGVDLGVGPRFVVAVVVDLDPDRLVAPQAVAVVVPLAVGDRDERAGAAQPELAERAGEVGAAVAEELVDVAVGRGRPGDGVVLDDAPDGRQLLASALPAWQFEDVEPFGAESVGEPGQSHRARGMTR